MDQLLYNIGAMLIHDKINTVSMLVCPSIQCNFHSDSIRFDFILWNFQFTRKISPFVNLSVNSDLKPPKHSFPSILNFIIYVSIVCWFAKMRIKLMVLVRVVHVKWSHSKWIHTLSDVQWNDKVMHWVWGDIHS